MNARFRALLLSMICVCLLFPALGQSDQKIGYWDYRAAVRAAERLDHMVLIDSMENEYGIYVAVGDRFGLVRLIYISGEGSQSIWTSKQLNGVVQEVFSTDLDRDGQDEIIAWTSAAMVYIWSPITKRLLYESLQNDFETIHSMTAANVDNDDAVEVIINADSHIYYLDGENFSREWTSMQEYEASRIGCADVDGDGSMELVLNSGQVVDARGGDVEWEDQAFGVRIELMDIDGDGLPEILTESDGLPFKIFDVDHRKEKHLQ